MYILALCITIDIQIKYIYINIYTQIYRKYTNNIYKLEISYTNFTGTTDKIYARFFKRFRFFFCLKFFCSFPLFIFFCAQITSKKNCGFGIQSFSKKALIVKKLNYKL